MAQFLTQYFFLFDNLQRLKCQALTAIAAKHCSLISPTISLFSQHATLTPQHALFNLARCLFRHHGTLSWRPSAVQEWWPRRSEAVLPWRLVTTHWLLNAEREEHVGENPQRCRFWDLYMSMAHSFSLAVCKDTRSASLWCVIWYNGCSVPLARWRPFNVLYAAAAQH